MTNTIHKIVLRCEFLFYVKRQHSTLPQFDFRVFSQGITDTHTLFIQGLERRHQKEYWFYRRFL